ncbi:arenicin-1-like [Ptychodera flava]|uniref:arenicin-1-like n=1 Tax=Ptychodera flava TaxID=63121 RepID=UPI00396A35B3
MKSLVIIVAYLAISAVQSAPADPAESKGNTYSVTINDGGKEREEIVVIDEEKNVEIFKSVSSDDADIVEDFNTGLEAFIPRDGDSCYVKPMNGDENTSPADLKADIESGDSKSTNPDDDEKDEYYTLAGKPIINRSVVGETISEKCEGRNIYWLTALSHGDQDRDKRACFGFRYCRYTYIGEGYVWRRCWYVIRCY